MTRVIKGGGGHEYIFDPIEPANAPSQEVLDGVEAGRCKNLWRAVLLLALQEAGKDQLHKPDSHTRRQRFDAVMWLLADGGRLKKDRDHVCDLAGINPLALDRAVAARSDEFKAHRLELLTSTEPERHDGRRKAEPPTVEAARAPFDQKPKRRTPKFKLTLDVLRAELERRGIKLDNEYASDAEHAEASSLSGCGPAGGLRSSEETIDAN
jgi:hypothetical protein